MSLIIEVGYSV